MAGYTLNDIRNFAHSGKEQTKKANDKLVREYQTATINRINH